MLAQFNFAIVERLQGLKPTFCSVATTFPKPMKAKTLALLLSELGIEKSHSRPYVSDGNPFSEAQFKTVKYHPTYPDRFGCVQDARVWARPFFDWYNYDHYHVGLNLLTPAVVHSGQAEAVRQQRQAVLAAAYAQCPQRFVRGEPVAKRAPDAVWINPPVKSNLP
jgi:putative transposase